MACENFLNSPLATNYEDTFCLCWRLPSGGTQVPAIWRPFFSRVWRCAAKNWSSCASCSPGRSINIFRHCPGEKYHRAIKERKRKRKKRTNERKVNEWTNERERKKERKRKKEGRKEGRKERFRMKQGMGCLSDRRGVFFVIKQRPIKRWKTWECLLKWRQIDHNPKGIGALNQQLWWLGDKCP